MHSVLGPLLKQANQRNLLLILLVLFIIIDVQIPNAMADLLDNVFGKIIIVILVLSLLKINYILGVFGIVAGYTLLQRIAKKTGGVYRDYVPNEYIKAKKLEVMNPIEHTLEEEVVKKMETKLIPNVFSKPTYQPTLNHNHDAEHIN
tara:strand:- start:1179 stop:1619 length:441 start_codon:yes stop_codon:yes gene_type:complete